MTPSSPAPASGRVQQVPRLGRLLIGQGILFLLWAAFCLFAIAVGVLNARLGSATKNEDLVVLIAYGAFCISALPVGILQITAGAGLLHGNGRALALVALWTGVASLFLGAVLCLPTGVALLIHGMMVLTDPDVKASLA